MEGKLDIMMENHPCIYLIRCIIHAVHVVRSGVPTGHGRSNRRTLVKAPFLLIMFAAVSFGASR